MPITEPPLDADEIQGNVVPGFNSSYQRVIGLRFGDRDEARAWLGQTPVSTLRAAAAIHAKRRAQGGRQPTDAEDTDEMWVNLCFSYGGLEVLIDDHVDEIWDPWFKAGMWRVAGSLGDGDTSGWEHGGGEATTPHVLAILGDESDARLTARCEKFVARAESRGLRLVCDDWGARLPENREHFGFKDGISVPVARGTVDDVPLHPSRLPAEDPLADRFTRRHQALLWPGQAVFGYPTQNPTDVLRPGADAVGGPDWMRNGSFLVFRRLRQHVERFHGFTASAAEEFSRQFPGVEISADRVAAMLVGRWPNGTPLVRYPETPGPESDEPDNRFGYVAAADGVPSDLDGLRCPHVAHVRKVNPRDAPTDRVGEATTLTLQPFRRGVPWGPLYAPAHAQDRGLLFLAYSTSIRDGFGALSLSWINGSDAPEAGLAGRDMIVGHHDDHVGRRVRLPLGDGVAEAVAPEPWVEATGGGFYFSPSVDMLKQLAESRM